MSLETPVGDEGRLPAWRLHRRRRCGGATRGRQRGHAQEELNGCSSGLPQRERKVIELRFGLSGEHPRTLEEVGQRFGVTRERIRQIENKTLAKLKSYRDSQRLREFLD